MEVAAADNFMQEVRDNFLRCKLCSKDFDRPKTLPCMHTFCHGCLVKYADEQTSGDSKQTYRYSTYCKPITCPVCRKRTDITKNDIDTLPDNFLISSLSIVIRDKSEDTVSCQICTRRPKGRKPTAIQRCLECNKQMCKRCVATHQSTKVTQSHTLYALENAHRLVCSEHDEEAVRFICKTCAKCICVFCTHTNHKGHVIMSILEGSENCQEELERTMETCEDQIRRINDQLLFIEMWEKCYNDTKEHIMATSTDFLTQVEKQKSSILAKLDDLYGPDILDMLNKKDSLIQNLEGLSSACKYRDIVATSHSIESIFLQNELQSKVKHLLNTPLPVPTEQLPNNDLTISFEKGGLSLGSLVTCEGEEEPLYFDAEDMDSIEPSIKWCRRCRSRSRSRSEGIEFRGDRMSARSLTPFKTDTDISLTDVSALGTMSPLLSTKNSTSYSSELDRIHQNIETVDFGVQVDLGFTNGTSTGTSDQQHMMNGTVHSQNLAIPDVVSSTKLMSDSSSQCEVPQTLETSSQYPLTQLQDSTCQSPHITQVDSATQHFAHVVDAFCQSAQPSLVHSSTQWVEFEPKKQMRESSCQNEAIPCVNSGTQYDIEGTPTVEVGSQYELSVKDNESQYDSPFSANMQTMTDLTFSLAPSVDSLITVGKNTSTNIRYKLSPINKMVDNSTMKTPEVVSHYTLTVPIPQRHFGTCTESVAKSETATDPIRFVGCSQYSQTISVPLVDANTNTQPLPQLSNSETNTDRTTQNDQANQTLITKSKSRGINAKPSTVECGAEAKPVNTSAFTNTESIARHHINTQTTPSPQLNRATNTLPVLSTNRGVTAHIIGVSNQTSTADLIHSLGATTQTARCVVDTSSGPDLISYSENSTNTLNNTGVNVASGPDHTINNLKSVAVGTPPVPSQRTIGVNVGAIKTNSWTNPIVLPVSSKACGTEKIRHRHVGLYVRPASTDGSTMTLRPEQKHKSCGDNLFPSQSSKQMDTSGLVKYTNSQTNTERLVEKKVIALSNSTQTNNAVMADNYTVMLHGLPVDKSTNTPQQLPQEILDQFQRGLHPSDPQHRTIQPDWMCDTHSLSMTRVPSASSSKLANHMELSMPRTNPPNVPHNSVEVADSAQSEPSPSAPHRFHNPADQRSHQALQTIAVKPVMCDQSTSTATLSSLLHPDKSATDSMDDKISECIVKLRQVTKKLQKSSADVSKSETSTDMSLTPELAHDESRFRSDVMRKRRQSTPDIAISASSGLSDYTIHKATMLDASQLAGNVDECTVFRNVTPQNKVSMERTSDSSKPSYGAPAQCLSYWPAAKLQAIKDDSRTSSALTNATIIRALKRFSRNRQSKSEVLATSTSTTPRSHEEPASTEPSNAGDGHLTTRRAETKGSRSWDLKSLVHEEDRLKKAMRGSSEQLNLQGLQSTNLYARSRKSSSASTESSALSQMMYSAESSRYGSTESLNQPTNRRGLARVVDPSSECVITPPNSSNISSGNQATPDNKDTKSKSLPTKTGKTKARSRQLETSILLGHDSKIEPQRSKRQLPVKNVPVKSQTTRDNSVENRRIRKPNTWPSKRKQSTELLPRKKSIESAQLQRRCTSALRKLSPEKKLQTMACASRLANHESSSSSMTLGNSSKSAVDQKKTTATSASNSNSKPTRSSKHSKKTWL